MYKSSPRQRIFIATYDFDRLLAIGLRVERRLGQEDGVLFGRKAEFVVEGVVPYLLHIVPGGKRNANATATGHKVQK